MRETPACRLVSAIATLCACFLLFAIFIIQIRYVGVTTGLVPPARAHAEAVFIPPASNGETIMADYCSEAVAASDFANPAGRASTSLVLDDAWFLHDSTLYQHELATTCAVLSAICNSESQYYSNVDGAAPYAERALHMLGFDDVRTESYALRSTIPDELGALFAGNHDGAAYAFARKTIPAPDGAEPYTLVFVGIRGSYGVEWLSNFNLAGAEENSEDHRGFRIAESEIEHALASYVKKTGASPNRTCILITGHSRGGAIANLLAARLDERAQTAQAVAPASSIYAYTFAAPGTTCRADSQSPAFGNIFNVVIETDIVPQLPLSTWGYERYGVTVSLPRVASSNFAPAYEAAQEAFLRNTGVTLYGDERTLTSLASFGEEAESAFPAAEASVSLEGMMRIAQAILRIDFGAALASHYPDTYIAWMQSTESNHLSFD